MSEEIEKMEKHFEAGTLMAKFLLEELNAEEQTLFDEWLSHEENKNLWTQISNREYVLSQLSRLNEIKENKDVYRRKLNSKLAAIYSTNESAKRWRSNWQRYVAAASVFFLLSITAYIWYNRQGKTIKIDEEKFQLATDATPGQFKAKLTLADGSVIVLDSAATGQLTRQGSTVVLNKDGKLIYQQQGKSAEVLYNTLSTSKGEMFATVLADGSKVWLNSQSSIRYPVAMAGEKRNVEITGEAYFEVSTSNLPNGKRRPFIVSVNGMLIEVLGTFFNVNGYTDEDVIKTTLLEGKVKVVNDSSLAILNPGQQAQVADDFASVVVINDADVEQAVAWKNGYFQFKNDELKTILRQLARWYDLEVVFEGNVSNDVFIGKIPRNTNISTVLNVLETNQVHFRVEGKKLIVSP